MFESLLNPVYPDGDIAKAQSERTVRPLNAFSNVPIGVETAVLTWIGVAEGVV
jgi:hypothetical protein